MYDKVVVNYDKNSKTLYDNEGSIIGVLIGSVDEYEDKNTNPEMVLSLVKQGVSAEEIIKLRNAELL